MFQSTIVKKYITTQSKDELISKWDLFKSFFHDIGNQNMYKMSNQEKKERKRKSIELMESIKVREWEKNQVFNEISSFEWVEWKR
jgi:hypothetical protein